MSEVEKTELKVVQESREYLTEVLNKDIREERKHPVGCGCSNCRYSADKAAEIAREWLTPPAIVLEDEVIDRLNPAEIPSEIRKGEPPWEMTTNPSLRYGQSISPEIHSVPNFDWECSDENAEAVRRVVPVNEEARYEVGTLIKLFRKKKWRLVNSAGEEEKLTHKPTRVIVVGQYETPERNVGRWAVVVGLANKDNKAVLPGRGGEEIDFPVEVGRIEKRLVWIGLVNHYVPGESVNKDEMCIALVADVAEEGALLINRPVDPVTVRKVVEGLDLYFKEQYSDSD